MNNIIFLTTIFCFIINSSTYGQLMENGTVPIEEYHSYRAENGIPENTYFKDVNHVLDDYIGTWEGVYNNKTYTFEIDTVLGVNGNVRPSIRFDETRLRYQIKNESGSIEVSTMNKNDEEALEGSLFDEYNQDTYTINYYGEDMDEVECGDAGTLYLKLKNNNTQLEVYSKQADYHILEEGECPDFTNPPFPNYNETPMTLTKEE